MGNWTNYPNSPFLTVRTSKPDIKKRVLFKHGEIFSMTQFSQATFLPGQIAPIHSHDDMYGLQAERRCMPGRHDA